MTIRRRVEITVESKLLGLRRPPTGSPTAAVWCPHCSAPSLMLAPDEAAVLAGVSTRTIYRWVETAQLHFTETPDGRLLVCPNSLTQ